MPSSFIPASSLPRENPLIRDYTIFRVIILHHQSSSSSGEWSQIQGQCSHRHVLLELQRPDFKLLTWTAEDVAAYTEEARTLGAPLEAGEELFREHRYFFTETRCSSCMRMRMRINGADDARVNYRSFFQFTYVVVKMGFARDVKTIVYALAVILCASASSHDEGGE